jgi:hypothetical protein
VVTGASVAPAMAVAAANAQAARQFISKGRFTEFSSR